MQTSQRGLALIMGNEGFSATVYPDAGQEAIGYGHDLLPGEGFPNGITQDQATAILAHDLATRFEPAVNRLAPQANQNQFDSLVDFCFNLGVGSLEMMLAHGWDEVTEQIPLWCHVAGVENANLKARRAAEIALFNTPA